MQSSVKKRWVWGKNCVILTLLSQNSKKLLPYLKLKLQIFQNAKFHIIKKELNLGQKLSYLGTFGLEFVKKTIVVFEIIQNGTIMKLGPKLFYFSNFRPEFEKAITIFEISSFKFVKIKSFMLKKKILIKIEIYGYFWLQFKETVVMLEISSLEFDKMQSFIWNKKIDFRTKNMFYFYDPIWRKYYHIRNQHVSICQNTKFHVKQKTLSLGP